jgi:hypothetical protein
MIWLHHIGIAVNVVVLNPFLNAPNHSPRTPA